MSPWEERFFMRMARLAFDEGDYGRLKTCCERLLAEAPENKEVLRMLGEAAVAMRDAATAVTCFQGLLRLEPADGQACFLLAKAYMQEEAWEASLLALNKAAECLPQNVEIAHARELVGRLVANLAVVGASEQHPPPEPDALAAQTREAVGLGAWPEVKRLATEWLACVPNGQEPRYWRGYAAVRLGEYADAYRYLDKMADFKPWRDDYRLAMGTCLRRLAQPKAAMHWLKLVLGVQPEHADALAELACCERALGDAESARGHFEQCLKLQPGHKTATDGLVDLAMAADRPEEAQVWLKARCAVEPNDAETWYNLGVATLYADVESADCVPIFSRAIELKPDYAEAFVNLGAVFQRRTEHDKAEQCYLRALSLRPDQAQAWHNLGQVYALMGRMQDAEGCLARAVAVDPNYMLAWNGLSSTLTTMRRFDEAETVARHAAELAPRDFIVLNDLGNVLSARGKVFEALEAYDEALALRPDMLPSLSNKATLLGRLCRFKEARAIFEPLVDDLPDARSNYLFTLNYDPDLSSDEIVARYRDIVRRFYPARKYHDYANERSPQRRLRVGYVSPDFRNHSCRFFIEPLIANHDPERVELFAYSLVRSPDQYTEALKPRFHHWRHLVGTSSEAAAEMIRADGIDILVDLASHTEGNRLEIFALKPAPVQVSWMGYNYTTGLEAMDYFLSEEAIVPPGAERWFTETPWRMPPPAHVYRPNENMPGVQRLPALKNGRITFTSLSRSIRINYRVVRTWARILNALPDSILIMNSNGLNDPGMQRHYHEQFAAHGIAPERVLMEYVSPPWHTMNRADIALDCFPHSSGTTLFESLWQGLPYITLRDRPSMGRLGSAILETLELDELIADSEDEYVEKALRLAGDVQGLAALRAGLRSRMAASVLCDEARFARNVEAAYQAMWQAFCEGDKP